MSPSLSAQHAAHPLVLALITSLALSACGGGGGGGDSAATASSGSPTSSTTDNGSPTGSTGATGETGSTTVTSAAPDTVATEALLVAQAEAAAAAAAQQAASAAQVETVAQATTASTAEVAPSTTSETVLATPETLSTVQASANTVDATPTLTVRARADLAGGVGAMMSVRLNGSTLGSVEVKSTTFADYKFSAAGLKSGAKVDVVFTNDALVNGVDRNLHVAYVDDGSQLIQPSLAGVVYDRGAGAKAFDGLDTIPGQSGMAWNGALRFSWPTAPAADVNLARKNDAVRFLQQASFGPTTAEVNKLVSQSYADWITAQQALAYAPAFVTHIQAKYAQGDAWRPKGASYTSNWVGQKFWERAANAPDQLRERTAFALHQIFMVSQADSSLYYQSRAYANYVDLLRKNAFGNYRTLLEDMALSPAMGIYLSHMRNRKEDAATGRMPDENFAREVMQLFTIGLYELNTDGTPKRDSSGNPIETYSTADVLAMAKVFTGWSWAYPDAQLTDSVFRWSTPAITAASDSQIDLLPMKAYPGQHSTAEKKLFTGKAWATTLPAGNSAQADLKAALDVLFNHPNVGPFIGRQLIQRLVSSNPSAAYVGRVAAVFNNNGKGVRGDLAAVVRAILLDTEARTAGSSGAGKLREPVLKVAHWMRALGATSASGEYLLQWLLEDQGQRALAAPSVFGYYRPGYVPANTSFASSGATAPEFQIVNESTVAAWLNMAEGMAGSGMGWNTATSANDVAVNYTMLGSLASGGNLAALPDQLNLLLLGGRMSGSLRQQILDTMGAVSLADSSGAAARARAAVFLTLASPEYVFQP